jgi:hypothetical protein
MGRSRIGFERTVREFDFGVGGGAGGVELIGEFAGAVALAFGFGFVRQGSEGRRRRAGEDL